MQTQQTLVKYNNPLLVSTTAQGKTRPVAGKKAQLTPTEDILNSILPPREWTQDGQLWVQYVSSNPATRLDVITLQDQLDKRLLQNQARETGICPLREELYAQCFDELIRQLTINCAERGLLLLRVRDEIRMTIASYQTLYESSIAFGMRRALQSEQKKGEMTEKLNSLQTEIVDLEQSVTNMASKCTTLVKKNQEQWDENERKHRDEVGQLRQHNQALKDELEKHLSMSK